MAFIRSTSWQERTSLDGGWELLRTAPGVATSPEAVEALAERWMPAPVPGTLASALRAQGVDPTGAGDLDATDVWYRLRFCGPTGAEVAALHLEGLATVAEVWLNGRRLFRSGSMWQAHRVDVASLLRGENVLHLRFVALGPLLAERRPRPRWKTRLVAQQQLRWWRTTFLGRIPAWTPPAPPVGPFRPVLLEHGAGPGVFDARVRTRVSGESGTLELSFRTESGAGRHRAARLRLGGREGPMEGEGARRRELHLDRSHRAPGRGALVAAHPRPSGAAPALGRRSPASGRWPSLRSASALSRRTPLRAVSGSG